MFTFTYHGNVAAIVIEGSYVYEFSTLEEAQQAAQNADEINVVYHSGNRNTLMDITPAVKQGLKVKAPTAFDIW